MTICPHCRVEFAARRTDQVYCCAKCRLARYQSTKGDGALRGRVVEVVA